MKAEPHLKSVIEVKSGTPLKICGYRIYSIKRRPRMNRIWDKKVKKRRPRISAPPPMPRLFEEFRITRKITINCSTTTKEFALTADIFALVIMKLSGFFLTM